MTRTVPGRTLRISSDQQKPEAVLFAEKNNNLSGDVRLFARTLFPDLKEIVLIRDPRDLLCSQLSYFRRNDAEAIQEITGASRQILRIKEEEAHRVSFVKYESLIIDPANTSQQLADHLNIAQLPLINSVKEASAFKVHGTSGSPEASIGRWRNQLPEDQQRWCGANWTHFLETFGYL
jgi:Sulfotransferase domain